MHVEQLVQGNMFGYKRTNMYRLEINIPPMCFRLDELVQPCIFNLL